MSFEKSSRYADLKAVYAQCSGPGGLKLAEYMADRMGVLPGQRLVDIGTYRGYQTCFLAKEYGVSAVGIDPWDDRETGIPHIDFLMRNAEAFGVADRVLGVKTGVPDSRLPTAWFDHAYCTTTLEMIRGMDGMEAYRAGLAEICRILKPGGILGLAEPMHFDVPVPDDLAVHVRSNRWEACFATLAQTEAAVRECGFTVRQAGHCEDADAWWNEFIAHSPDYDVNEDDAIVIARNNRRWLSYGYVVAEKA